MMKCLRSFLSITLVAASLFPVVSTAADPVDNAGVQIQRQEQNGITYLSGGIGEDEAKAIQQATGYNLHMTFSIGPEGKYVPDVDVVIQKVDGQSVLTLTQAGPLVYVQLPPGKYSVVATRGGQERRDTFDVGSGAPRKLVFSWAGDD